MGPIAGGERTAKRAAALGVGAVLASVLLVATAVIASTYTAQRVAANARALHWANGALGSAAIARASVGQAVFFAVDQELGVASQEAVDVAVSNARHDLDVVAGVADGSADDAYVAPSGLTEEILAFVSDGRAVLDRIDSGAAGEAADFKATELDPRFEELTETLSAQQQTVARSISATETLSGRIDTITRVGIILVLPAIAFTIYRGRARRSLEAARRRHAAELEIERRSAAARDEFFAAVSHELRTPLTTILGFSEILADGAVPAEEHGELAEIIRKDAVDLERRISDMVAVARSAAGGIHTERGEHDAEQLVRRAIEAAAPTKEVMVDCEQGAIAVDPVTIEQVVRNLVSNADHHGGDRVWVTGGVVGDRYLITVADDGPGFDPTGLDAAHGPFAHDHRQAILEGTIGLGLTAAAALTEANGGALAHRRSGGWTQLGVFLPRAPAAAPSDDSAAPLEATA